MSRTVKNVPAVGSTWKLPQSEAVILSPRKRRDLFCEVLEIVTEGGQKSVRYRILNPEKGDPSPIRLRTLFYFLMRWQPTAKS